MVAVGVMAHSCWEYKCSLVRGSHVNTNKDSLGGCYSYSEWISTIHCVCSVRNGLQTRGQQDA